MEERIKKLKSEMVLINLLRFAVETELKMLDAFCEKQSQRPIPKEYELWSNLIPCR